MVPTKQGVEITLKFFDKYIRTCMENAHNACELHHVLATRNASLVTQVKTPLLHRRERERGKQLTFNNVI